ncbi:MAG: D-sedoheptulose 7-phosphate isomerase [Verrucomicrobiales bacterium]
MSTSGQAIYLEQVEASIACLEASKSIAPQIAKAADLLASVLRDGGHLFACGNGGSAADASHFTTELLCRLKDDRAPLAAMALTADSSFLTATANDYGYEDVFSRQVQGLGRPGDVLVAISTSGNSPNVEKALLAAKESKMLTVSLLGKDGGSCAGLAEIDLIVPSQSTARIQETHQVIIHTLCLLIEHQLFDMPASL